MAFVKHHSLRDGTSVSIYVDGKRFMVYSEWLGTIGDVDHAPTDDEMGPICKRYRRD